MSNHRSQNPCSSAHAGRLGGVVDIFPQPLLRQMEEVGQKYHQIATAQLKICCCSWVMLDCKPSLCDCTPAVGWVLNRAPVCKAYTSLWGVHRHPEAGGRRENLQNMPPFLLSAPCDDNVTWQEVLSLWLHGRSRMPWMCLATAAPRCAQ